FVSPVPADGPRVSSSASLDAFRFRRSCGPRRVRLGDFCASQHPTQRDLRVGNVTDNSVFFLDHAPPAARPRSMTLIMFLIAPCDCRKLNWENMARDEHPEAASRNWSRNI